MKAEKLMRRVMCGAVAGVLAGGLLLPLMARAATSGTATIQVTINNPKPTCNVSVRSSYDLGTLSRGQEKRHAEFPITLACTGSVKSALTASLGSGRAELQPDQYKVSVSVDGQSAPSPNGPFFWLLDSSNNRPVKLTNAGADAFCTATGQNRTCKVTPVTHVMANSMWGSRGAVRVVFNVIYPA
ncbi:UNVERIFIED_ORG: hypothetical protein FHU00_5028 [Citrobacter freundii]